MLKKIIDVLTPEGVQTYEVDYFYSEEHDETYIEEEELSDYEIYKRENPRNTL